MVPEGLSLPPRSLESLLVDRSKSEHDKIPTSEFGKQFHDVYGKWSTSGLSPFRWNVYFVDGLVLCFALLFFNCDGCSKGMTMSCRFYFFVSQTR